MYMYVCITTEFYVLNLDKSGYEIAQWHYHEVIDIHIYIDTYIHMYICIVSCFLNTHLCFLLNNNSN